MGPLIQYWQGFHQTSKFSYVRKKYILIVNLRGQFRGLKIYINRDSILLNKPNSAILLYPLPLISYEYAQSRLPGKSPLH